MKQDQEFALAAVSKSFLQQKSLPYRRRDEFAELLSFGISEFLQDIREIVYLKRNESKTRA